MQTDWVVMVNTFIGFGLTACLGYHFALRWDHRVMRALAIFFFGLGVVLMLAYLTYIGVNYHLNQAYRTGLLNLLLLWLLIAIRKGIMRMAEPLHLPVDAPKKVDHEQ